MWGTPQNDVAITYILTHTLIKKTWNSVNEICSHFQEATSHEGSKATRAIFLKNGLVFTTGFSKRSERQYSLRAPGHLDDPITMVELDSSNGVMFPMYDPDTNLVYLCGE